MNKVTKFIELKDLKVSDQGNGSIEGYRAVFSVDEGGDLIVPGAFRDTIPDYISSGFTAESHNWSFSNAVGFPVEAHEDDHGFWVKSVFHSTPDAQNVRTIAKERMKAGKKVGFSFGYSPLKFEYLEPRDYKREIPKYVKPQDLDYNMRQAERFARVRLLKKLEVIEDSLVTAPMNRQAGATGVKSLRQRNEDVTREQLWSKSLRLRSEILLTLCGDRETNSLYRRLNAARLEQREIEAQPYKSARDRVRLASLQNQIAALETLARVGR